MVDQHSVQIFYKPRYLFLKRYFSATREKLKVCIVASEWLSNYLINYKIFVNTGLNKPVNSCEKCTPSPIKGHTTTSNLTEYGQMLNLLHNKGRGGLFVCLFANCSYNIVSKKEGRVCPFAMHNWLPPPPLSINSLQALYLMKKAA